MKKIIILIFLCLFTTNAFSISLFSVLNETYNNNTQLNAERENIKASVEDVNISKLTICRQLLLVGPKVMKTQIH